MNTQKSMINIVNFFSNVAPYLFSNDKVFEELIENSLRANAQNIKLNLNEETNILTVKNDGDILKDFSSLFIIAQSNYSENITKAQKPAGMGILSLLAISKEVTFTSGTKCISIISNKYFNDKNYRLNIFDNIQQNNITLDGFEITAILNNESLNINDFKKHLCYPHNTFLYYDNYKNILK